MVVAGSFSSCTRRGSEFERGRNITGKMSLRGRERKWLLQLIVMRLEGRVMMADGEEAGWWFWKAAWKTKFG